MTKNVEKVMDDCERKNLEKKLRYKLADAGFYIGAVVTLIYAARTSDGEGLNYMINFSKQLVSEPIITVCIGGGYIVGEVLDLKSRIKQRQNNK